MIESDVFYVAVKREFSRPYIGESGLNADVAPSSEQYISTNKNRPRGLPSVSPFQGPWAHLSVPNEV